MSNGLHADARLHRDRREIVFPELSAWLVKLMRVIPCSRYRAPIKTVARPAGAYPTKSV